MGSLSRHTKLGKQRRLIASVNRRREEAAKQWEIDRLNFINRMKAKGKKVKVIDATEL